MSYKQVGNRTLAQINRDNVQQFSVDYTPGDRPNNGGIWTAQAVLIGFSIAEEKQFTGAKYEELRNKPLRDWPEDLQQKLAQIAKERNAVPRTKIVIPQL